MMMATRASRALLILWLLVTIGCLVNGFAPSSLTRSSFQGTTFRLQTRPPASSPQRRSSSLCMFLGNEGGILGVGAPEVFTILLVGYFVLGPSDLYKLVKEIGKGIQNFRTLSSDVTKTFESNMESQLQLEELRKAQRELNDAFSFRRSINVDEEGEAFSTTPDMSVKEETTSTTTTTTESSSPSSDAAPKKRKKRRRVKKKKVVEEEANGTAAAATSDTTATVPDLEMPAPWDVEEPDEEDRRRTEQELQLRQERMERLKTGSQPSGIDEFGAPTAFEEPPAMEQDRFAQQLSSDWNAQIMANEEKLEPLAKVMERLAILEEEKNAADARLEEEFRLRSELEEKFYQEKRAILEEAAAEVQADAYASVGETTSESGGGGEGNSEEQKKKETT